LGDGKYKRAFARMHQNKATGKATLVRNVVFEPTASTINHVAKAMQQIEAAFFWNKPAIISSHRVNFCGHIDPRNREKGLGALQELLQKIVARWPEVEFLSVAELTQLIQNSVDVSNN